MRHALCLLMLCLLGLCGAAWAEVLVRTETALLKVLQDDPWPPGPPETSILLNSCRGEVEWGQIVLRSSEAVARVQVAAGGWRRGGGAAPANAPRIAFHIAHYVLVEKPSGNRVRRVAKWPDPLPEGARCSLEPGLNQAIYVRVDTPRSCRPGVYSTDITIAGEGRPPARVPLTVVVWDVEIPEVPTMRSSYYVWWDGLRDRFGLGDEIEPLDRFFWFLLEHRLCPMTLPVEITDPRADRYMADPRVNGVRVPYQPAEQLRPTLAHVRAKGWLDRTYIYLYDEPARRDWWRIPEAGNIITGIEPGMQRLDSIQPEPDLEGHVSIWCPNVEAAYLYRDRIAGRLAAGEEVWWYTCAVPKYPYPNYLLDEDAIGPRLLLWMQALYGMTGSMYINTIHWGPEGWDPWERGVISMPEQSNNHDGLLMYSGRGPEDCYPVTSVRLEMIRDGIEDWELVQLLHRTAQEAAEACGASAAVAEDWVQGLCTRVMPEVPEADREPVRLLRARQRLLSGILRLRREPGAVVRPPQGRRERPLGGLDPGKFVDCPRASAPPTPDGDISDACWNDAIAANAPGMRTVVTRLRNLTGRIWPSENTIVCTAWTEGRVHLCLYCQEPEPDKIVAEGAEGVADGVWLQLGEQRRLAVTAGGTVTLEGPWPAGAAEVAVARDEQGYGVEITLNANALGLRTATDATLLLNFGRYAAPGEERLVWVSRHGHRDSPQAMGTLTMRER